MKKVLTIIGAFVLWMLALIGVIAVAVWLRLSLQETRALVIIVAFVAFFGAFLPIVRLGVYQKS